MKSLIYEVFSTQMGTVFRVFLSVRCTKIIKKLETNESGSNFWSDRFVEHLIEKLNKGLQTLQSCTSSIQIYFVAITIAVCHMHIWLCTLILYTHMDPHAHMSIRTRARIWCEDVSMSVGNVRVLLFLFFYFFVYFFKVFLKVHVTLFNYFFFLLFSLLTKTRIEINSMSTLSDVISEVVIHVIEGYTCIRLVLSKC